MENIVDLTCFLNDYLAIDQVKDYCPNGLQVAGASQINHIVAGVTASQALLDEAVKQKAQAVLVHHGYFWKGDSPVINGMLRSRLKTLLMHDINLLAYHLPLDVHPQVGNNALLGDSFGFVHSNRHSAHGTDALLSVGELPEAMKPAQLSDLIQQKLGRSPLHIKAGPATIKKVAWCTGAAQDLLFDATQYAVDAFITGEISERTVHMAREYGVHFFAAGHHATERYGVRALAELLADKFDISCEFVDIDNPV
jgi:dinuclear metal center YbgI/SA1388 family protein